MLGRYRQILARSRENGEIGFFPIRVIENMVRILKSCAVVREIVALNRKSSSKDSWPHLRLLCVMCVSTGG